MNAANTLSITINGRFHPEYDCFNEERERFISDPRHFNKKHVRFDEYDGRFTSKNDAFNEKYDRFAYEGERFNK